MKKIFAMMLALILVISCLSVSAGAELTSENITLSYATKGEEIELTKVLAARFMEEYPNITVEIKELDLDDYDNALINLAANQDLPDVFWVGSVTDAIANKWAMNLDPFYAADPDAASISPAVLRFAQVGGKRYSIPATCKPTVAVLNKTLFEKYNVDMPPMNWTLEEFFELAEELSHPENHDYGVANQSSFDKYLFTQYGYDGKEYTFDETWVSIWEKAIEWRVNKVAEMLTDEEKLAVFGDAEADPMMLGHVAISFKTQETGFKQLSSFLNDDAEAMSGCEFVFYPMPSTKLESNSSTMEFACISAACEYPREAWELAKWMTWSKEATILRTDFWNGRDTRMFMDAPMIMDEDVWAYVKENTADEKIRVFYENMEPIRPDIFAHAPNCIWMNVTWYFGGVVDKFAAGETTPADYAPVLRQTGVEQIEGWTGWEVVNGAAAE